MAEFGAVVRETRRLRGWTQAELARHAGVSRRWIIALESGQVGGAEFGRVLAVLSALDIGVALSPAVASSDAAGDSVPAPATRPPRREPIAPEPSLDLDAHLASFMIDDAKPGGREGD